MSSAKNEQYDVTNCELEHVNGEYVFNSKLDCHVHKSGKVHLYRTSKDYIWTIADSTRRKQYCFAQKIAPQPTGCSWNVYTGGVGAELLTSSMRVFNNTEIVSNASPLKRTTASKTSSKLSPMNTSLKPGPKLTSDKVSPLKPLTPVAPPTRTKPSSPVPPTAESRASPSFKAASASAAASAKQTIINVSNNILGVNNAKGPTVVRRTDSSKSLTPMQIPNQDTPQDTAQNTAPHTLQDTLQDKEPTPKADSFSPRSAIESEAVSPRISPRASFERVPSSGGVSPLHRPSSRLSMFEQVNELEAKVLQIRSVDDTTLQVVVPASAVPRLEHSQTTQTLPAQTLTEWTEVEKTWADSTVLLNQEVQKAHLRISDLELSLKERSADLEILRSLYEESQEQERVAREELHAQLALADEAQDHFAQMREVEALEQARDARAQAQEAILREQAALAERQTAHERAEAALLQVEIAKAQTRAAQDQLNAAQLEAHEADEAVGVLQEKLVLAHEKIAVLEATLEETHALPVAEVVGGLQNELQQANEKIAALEAALEESLAQVAALAATSTPVPTTTTTTTPIPTSTSEPEPVSVSVSEHVPVPVPVVVDDSELRSVQAQLELANKKICALQSALEVALPLPVVPSTVSVQTPVSPLDEESTMLRIEGLEQSLQEKDALLRQTTLALQVLQLQAGEAEAEGAVGGIEDSVRADTFDTQAVTTSTVTAATLPSHTSLASHTSHTSHVLRDRPSNPTLNTAFPSGADFQALFAQELTGFESFARDAVKCLEDLGHLDGAVEVLVSEVLAPMFEVCHKCVNDNLETKRALLAAQWGVEVSLDAEHDHTTAGVEPVEKLFWYASLQPLILSEIAALDNDALDSLVQSMGETVVELCASMRTAGAAGVIANTPGVLRIPHLSHLLLHYFAIAALSDPRCVLYPAPGRHIPYKQGFTMEVLLSTSISTSVSTSNEEVRALQEGEEVEVVFCGVYFDRPAEGDFLAVIPVIPALVRRLKA